MLYIALLTALGLVVFLVAEAVADGPRAAAVLDDADGDVVVVHARGVRVDAGEEVDVIGARVVVVYLRGCRRHTRALAAAAQQQ